MSTNPPRVMSIGQCDFDQGNIARVLADWFDATVDRAATSQEALTAIEITPYSLVLVNRILDSDGSSGLDLIRILKSRKNMRHVPVALLSNYADAQAAAVALGAELGFGKDALRDTETRTRLAALLGADR